MFGCVFNTWALDFMVDDIYYKVDTVTMEASVARKDNKPTYTGNVVIPETVTYEGRTYTVTTIDKMAFYGSTVESVTMPNTLTTIKVLGLADCKNLTEVIIPNSVTTIEDRVCEYDDALLHLYIGSGVTSLDEYINEFCYNLESIEVHPDTPVYDSRDNCNAIIETATNSLIVGCKNTVLPGSITEIGHSAFYCTGGPETVVIPDAVTKIGTIAFYSTQGVKHVTLGAGVVNMEYNPFCGMPDLESLAVDPANPKYDSREHCNAVIVTATNKLFAAFRNTVIPNTVTSIGTYAYLSCTGLDEIVIPPSVTTIDQTAFAESEIRHMTIPGTVKNIGSYAFDFCGYLQDVYIEDGVEQIGRRAFELCVGLKRCRLPNTITTLPYGLFWQCETLQELIIPNSVTTIEAYAAYCCDELKRLVIGSGVQDIGHYAFISSSEATSVTCLAPTPPDAYETSLCRTWKNDVVLRVPQSSLELYKTTYPWREVFLDIIGVYDDGSAGPGDVDGDGVIGISDVTTLIDAILSGDTSSMFVDNADVNGNGHLDIGDVVTIIDMLLSN